MSAHNTDLPTQYHATTTETKWQAYWQEKQVFEADPSPQGQVYSIVIPPPNVTGSLHMGHAFEIALIDTLVRYHRMKGENTLCVPGTDHASIAVQTLIEKQLKAEGKTRNDLGREEFLKRAWQWKDSSKGAIVNQMKRLGLSADWSRECFTLDETRAKAVLQAFVDMYQDGLIYRGNYLVNWCPQSQSAVSDLEVESVEVEGHLWYFRYPLTDGSGYVEVATTRPETMLGDTAVAVNPQDARYQHLIGKTLTLPITGREIPVIGDEVVEAEFGTGCVKVTPAHDPNDFAMGKRHQLPFINIMNKDGSLNENAGPFAGEDRFVARKKVVEKLEQEGALVKVENYRHTVPYSDRGKVPVEPLLSTQWFVKIKPLSHKALQALDEQQSPRFIPDRWGKVYRDWLVKLQDWCISRQLWWGHQIPAWYVLPKGESQITDTTPFIVAISEAEAQQKAYEKYGYDIVLIRDPDVLDTWFSSSLWPFTTLGWPENTEDFQRYYPTTTLVTGFDIIFFWVARMSMMAGYFTNTMPFQDVFIHGLVRDEKGKKMSKSANNGIDPLILVDKYGTDALRYTLIKEVAGAGQDISLQYDRQTDESVSVEASRNFANKLWNASRFVMMNLDGKSPQQLGKPNLNLLDYSDRWILSRYNQVIQQTHHHLENYGLGEAAKGLYDFIWGDFCDWYLELVKSRLRQNSPTRLVAQQTLAYVLEGILKLLHPFMPHITEEIWHTLTKTSGESLACQPFPVVNELLELQHPTMAVITPDKPSTPVSQFWQKIAWYLQQIPSKLADLSHSNQKALIVIGILFATLVSFKITSSVVTTIHNIPVIAPLFRLIGLGSTLWFIFRNLLLSENRQNFRNRVKDTLEEILGQKTSTIELSKKTTLIEPQLEEDFQLITEVIRTIRNLRAEVEIKPGLKVPTILQSDNTYEQKILQIGKQYIQDLAKVEQLTITNSGQNKVKQAITGVVATIQVLIPLGGIIDIDALRSKLEKNLAKLELEADSLTDRLGNPSFVNKAPEKVVEGTKNALLETKTQIGIIKDRLKLLSETP